MEALCQADMERVAEPSWIADWTQWTFMPHGHCYLWRPEILWPQVIADGLIALSYFSIPLIFVIFMRRRQDVPFHRLMVVFAVFILACGATHLIDLISVWEPLYRLQTAVKIITAAVSVLAVGMLLPALPQMLALPSLSFTNRMLQATASALRRSNHDLAQFAHVASHDLKEPLRMVSLNLDVVERRLGQDLPPEVRQHLHYAREGSIRMNHLLDGLLAYAEIDAVTAPAPPASPDAALITTIAALRPEFTAIGGTITHQPLPAVPLPPTHAEIIFRQLLGNALRFRHLERSLVVAIEAIAEPNQVGFTCRDNGIGIAPQHRLQVFRIFQRLHERGQYPGIGVGLATVQKIVERNGGTVHIADGRDGGIAVTICFPRSA